jgi:hypothetical protein
MSETSNVLIIVSFGILSGVTTGVGSAFWNAMIYGKSDSSGSGGTTWGASLVVL